MSEAAAGPHPSSGSTSWRRRAARGGLAVAALAAVGLVATNDPATTPFFLPCGFHLLTGWWCPGCGSTRALHALLRGDLTSALGFNAPVTAGLLLGPWLTWLARRRPGLRAAFLHPLTLGIGTVAMLLFALLRNLPWPPFSFLAPGG